MYAIPDAMKRAYQVLRSVTYGSNNVGTQGLQVISTSVGVMRPKVQILQDNMGGPVITADVEIYFMPGTNLRVDDQLLDIGDGTRWRVVKCFPWPEKMIVWAARGTQ